MRTYFKKATVTFYFTSIILCCFLAHNNTLGSTSNTIESDQNDTNIVGIVADYTITRRELEKRIISSLEPDPYKLYTIESVPKDANAILSEMLGEIAVSLEARKQGLLEDELISQALKTERQKRIVNLWVQDNIRKNRDKITATEQEIEKQLEASPNIDKNKAKSTIETAKANRILDQCYSDLYKNSEVKKIPENYSKVIKIHDRLLNHPVKPRPASYIRDYQIKEELTEEEKNLAIATFKNGKLTLLDWLDFLCDYAPPSRPKNLDTEEGVEQLLDKAIIKPLITADTIERGLDKDPAYLKQIRDYENELLLNKVKNEMNQEVNEPDLEDVTTFYNKNKEFFITGRIMKIDPIWCKDLESATFVKNQLNEDKDFNELKKEYSLYPESQPYQTSLNNEGYFWKEIWPGKKNDIIGPIKGYHSGGIKWRIVKIIEKEQGKLPDDLKELETMSKYLMMSEMAIENMTDYCLDTLKKYPHKIYYDRIKDIDPLNIK